MQIVIYFFQTTSFWKKGRYEGSFSNKIHYTASLYRNIKENIIDYISISIGTDVSESGFKSYTYAPNRGITNAFNLKKVHCMEPLYGWGKCHVRKPLDNAFFFFEVHFLISWSQNEQI